MSLMWAGWGVAIIAIFLIPVWHWIEKFKEKQWWEVYSEKSDKKTGRKYIRSQMESIGELKECKWVEVDQRYEFYFNIRGKRRVYYSLVSRDDLLSDWLLKKYLIVIYLMDCVVFKKKLAPSEYYDKEIEPSLLGKIYLAFSSVFHFGVSMLAGGGIMAIIFALFRGITASDSFQYFLIGFVVGIGISLVNSFLQDRGIIKVQNKKKKIKAERWIEPIESNYRVEDIYKVEYKIRMSKDQNDGASDLVVKPVKETMTYVQLADLILNRKAEVISQIQVDKREKKVSIAEQKRSRRSFLARSRYMWETIQNLKRQIRRLQRNIRSLHEQLDFVEATKDLDVAQLSSAIIAETGRVRETLKKVIARIYTSQLIEPDWNNTLKIALRELEEEKEEKKMEKMQNILDVLVKLLNQLSQSDRIDIKSFAMQFPEIIKLTDVPGNGGLRDGTTQTTQQKD